MAQRRMISLKVIDTDEFMDMPMSSQFLYFNFAMRADDDGFVGNPKRIIKMNNCTDDDIKVLVAKKFVIPFESGVCVIRHWRVHNYIQSDRYTETEYKEELNNLTITDGKYNKIQDNLLLGIDGNNKNVEDNNNVHKMYTQVRLGKVRLGKVNNTQNLKEYFEKEIQIPENQHKTLLLEEKDKFIEYWTEKSPNGKKERWEMEKVFDIKKRWRTWIRNVEARMKPKDFTPKYKKEVVTERGGGFMKI